jgi:DNA-binding NarL/FixJ family response regulator
MHAKVLDGGAKRKPDARRTILIVDDHPIVRHGLTQLLNQEPDLDVCMEAASAAEALALLERKRPDVTIADISLDGKNGLELVKAIRRRDTKMPILVLSMHDENLYAERALRAGANGYVMKQEAADRVLDGVRAVLRGEIFVSAKVASRCVRDVISRSSGPVDEFGIGRLSDRELEVFEWLGRGLSSAQIAARLALSSKTIETYRSHIKSKLHLASSVELVQHAVNWVEGRGAP